jgi:hypothetical protein
MVTITKRLASVAMLGSLLLASALPALAEETSSRPAADLACMQAAVEKRDNALIAAIDAYHTAARAALEKRRDALKAGWALTDRTARRAALRKVWSEFKKSHKKAVQDLRKAKRNAWKQFRTDRKACGPAAASDDPTAEGTDAQL